MREWFVEGPRGGVWLAARDGDHACDRYIVRFALPRWALDMLVVSNVRHKNDGPSR